MAEGYLLETRGHKVIYDTLAEAKKHVPETPYDRSPYRINEVSYTVGETKEHHEDVFLLLASYVNNGEASKAFKEYTNLLKKGYHYSQVDEVVGFLIKTDGNSIREVG